MATTTAGKSTQQDALAHVGKLVSKASAKLNNQKVSIADELATIAAWIGALETAAGVSTTAEVTEP